MSALSGRFDDFEVLIGSDRGDGVYPVPVIKSSLAGETSCEFVLSERAEKMEAALERMRARDTSEELLIDFGSCLFSALFKGPALRLYSDSVARAEEGKGKGLRIRMHIRPPDLAGLPWELMYDPEKREFLALTGRALITRYTDVPRRPVPLQTELPLRILVAIAAPRDLSPLDSKAEVARIKKALAAPLKDDLIRFEVLQHTTTGSLRKALETPYHVLHFIGHGDFDEGKGSLVFEDEHGDALPVSGRILGSILKDESVRLVVLNACQSAQDTRNARAFTGVGPALAEAGIPAVVAMQFAMGDESAIAFTENFYEKLSRYLPVDECISYAREGLMAGAGMGSVDWATPVLFLRAPDGVIFVSQGIDLDAEKAGEEKIEHFCDLTTEPPEPAPPPADRPHEKEIIKHLWTVVDYPAFRRWASPDAAMSRWVAPYQDGQWDELARQDVTVVVEREPVTILLGDPGMGKTAILELLAFLYAEGALRGAARTLMIPVFARLSHFGSEGEDSLIPLVRVGLNRHGAFKLSPDKEEAQTRALLAERTFLFLLDGLNQIPGDAAQRAHRIAVVRRFLEAHPQHKYVISCRRLAYEDDPGWKEWIVLPHSKEDVEAFLMRRLGRERGGRLYQSLPERMREMARTPLLLSLLLEELRDRGDRAARQLGPLFANFSTRMLGKPQEGVTVEHKMAMLARLAYAMNLHQTHEFSRADTLKLIERETGEMRLEEAATPEELVDDLLDSGLLRSGSTEHVAFSHPFCRDYFVALALQGQFARGAIHWADKVGEYRWHEAIRFLASMVERPTALIRQLLAHDPLLAAECLLETESVDAALQGQVAAILTEYTQVGPEKEKRKAAALLTALQEAGMVPEVSAYPPAAAAPIAVREESETGATLPIGRGHLQVTGGPLTGQRIPLLDGTFCVGRSSKASFTLDVPSVSRRHAEIQVDGERLSIRDLGSTNGTRVNGRFFTDWHPLQDGDEILLGDLPLVVRTGDS